MMRIKLKDVVDLVNLSAWVQLGSRNGLDGNAFTLSWKVRNLENIRG